MLDDLKRQLAGNAALRARSASIDSVIAISAKAS
jgi:hypothetical protein